MEKIKALSERLAEKDVKLCQQYLFQNSKSQTLRTLLSFSFFLSIEIIQHAH